MPSWWCRLITDVDLYAVIAHKLMKNVGAARIGFWPSLKNLWGGVHHPTLCRRWLRSRNDQIRSYCMPVVRYDDAITLNLWPCSSSLQSELVSKKKTAHDSQTCSMPWGVLSLNLNSGKTWWSTLLLSIAPDCPCYNVLYDRGFLWWRDLNPMKVIKNPLGSWIQGSAGSPGSLAFFSKFWFGKRQNWIGREWGL